MKITGLSVLSGKAISIVTEDGIITDVRSTDGTGDLPWISPGFIDVQVNGYRGIDYSAENFTGADIRRISGLLAESGTVRHFPTIITNSRERILRNLSKIAATVRKDPAAAHAVPGIHIEGPFISSVDGPRGAHDAKFVRDPDVEEFRRWQEAAEGLIRIITIAPEREGAIEFIREVSASGVIVSLGHTAASPERILEAIRAGARMSTHLGNGSHGMIPRLKNYLWEQLAADELSAGIISDGYHLPDPVIRVIIRAKGSERVLLVSDVAPPAGSDPGRYNWGDITVEVHPDGHLGLADTEFLAGAGHLLDRGIARCVRASGIPLREAVTLCTANPGRLLGFEEYGEGLPEEFTPGFPADIAVFRFQDGWNRLEIEKTLSAGSLIFEKKESV